MILSVQGAIEVARIAERAFALVETQQPSLSETDGSGPVMMWISREFIDAVAAGTDQLAALLATIEARHFSSLERAIVKGAEA
ncbi:ABC-three component system protein [Bradyrhizobium sp. LM2.9]